MNWNFMNSSYQPWHGWSFFAGVLPFIGLLAIADLALRGYSMWFAARRSQKWWFIGLLVVNSLGILPLFYLYLNRNKKKK